MSKSKYSLFTTVALLAATGSVNAAIITIGASSSEAPTSIPTITVAPGAALSFSIFGQAEGATGYLSNASIGVFQSSAASFAGGQLGASNALPAPAANVFASTPTNTYASNISQIFGFNTATPNTTTNTDTAGRLILANIGGANTSRPTGAIDNTAAKLISTISGTAGSTPGTYYLYLGRTGSGITESPNFKAASYIGAAGASNTAVFGTGDTAIATAGSGTTANALSPNADAIVIIQAAGPSVSLSTSALGDTLGTVVVTPTGGAGNYTGGFADGPDATAGNYQITGINGADGGTVPVLIDFAAGATDADINAFVASVGASASRLAADPGWAAGFPGDFDVQINFANVGTPAFFNFAGLGGSLSVARVAAIPEPATLGLAGLAAVAGLARRRRA